MFKSTNRSRKHRNAHTHDGKNAESETFFSVGSKEGQHSPNAPFFQTKLSVGQVNDPYEQEADRVANSVVNNEGTVQTKEIRDLREKDEAASSGSIQRMCSHCAEEKEKEGIQRKEEEREKEKDDLVQTKSDGSATITPAVSTKIESSRGKGSNLPSKTKAEMQSAFGSDFSSVKIHTDNEAAQLNNSLHAQAFTHKNDIYFGAGKFRPDCTDGKRLLAHELTHVVQQKGASRDTISRQVAPPIVKSCGPDVTSQVESVWSTIPTDFASWSPADKLAASLYLVTPFVPTSANPRGATGTSFLRGSWAEPFMPILGPLLERSGIDPAIFSGILGGNGSWQLNRDAFDTIGLFVLSADWTLGIPGCGEPSCGGLSSTDLPRGFSDPCEDPSLCAFSVNMGGSCWLSGTVNYGTYGLMMKTSYDWCDRQRTKLLSLIPMAMTMTLLGSIDDGVRYIQSNMTNEEIAAAFLKELFSPTSLLIYVGGYKLWDMENPVNALGWARATYNGGPTAKAAGSNRPDCQITCPQTGALFPAWGYVWEPVRHR